MVRASISQSLQFNCAFDSFAPKNSEFNFVLPLRMNIVAPIAWQNVSILMISWSFGTGRVIVFAVSNAFCKFIISLSLDVYSNVELDSLPATTSSEGDKKMKNLVCIWISLCKIQYMIAIMTIVVFGCWQVLKVWFYVGLIEVYLFFIPTLIY